MQVEDLTTDELKELIKQTVAEALQELLPDPDAGKELKAEVNVKECGDFAAVDAVSLERDRRIR